MNAEATNWNNERSKLRTLFSKGEIIAAERKELEQYLVVLANTPLASGFPSEQPRHKEETETYAAIIRHLLMIQVGEALHAKSHRLAFLACIVSVIAIVISIIALFLHCQT